DDKDEVVGAEVLPSEGEVFLLTNDGKAKRVEEKEFPKQGRYGKGVIAWEVSSKEKLVGVVTGTPNHMATIHLSKGAPKSTRLDAASLRKRAATKGDMVVEVKAGEEAVSVNVAWEAGRFVGEMKEERGKTKSSKGKKVAKKVSVKPKKKVVAKKAKSTAKKSSAKKTVKKMKVVKRKRKN
ncbi:MAG TPA: DNA gyrase C-terminal beta-propeller domain-containing protein, partial [Anaerolineales bacterium]|nr:DNA gyrase C-terminal beta-propeller domain-containing protein [Anaerolineales bacterium]